MTKVTKLVACAVVCLVGCGGTSSTGLDGDGGFSDASAGDGATGDGATDGGTTGDGATGDGATTGDAALGSNDGGSPLDAGPGGNMSTFPCGNTACAIGAQVCCVQQLQNPPPPFAYGCVTGTTCPSMNNTALGCSSTANCPANQVCCIDQPQNGPVSSSCRTSCPANGAQLCDPSAMPTGCPMGVMCSSANIGDWGLPPSFATCGGKGN